MTFFTYETIYQDISRTVIIKSKSTNTTNITNFNSSRPYLTFQNIVVLQNEPNKVHGFYDEDTGTLYKFTHPSYLIKEFIKSFNVNFMSLGSQETLGIDAVLQHLVSAAEESSSNEYEVKPRFTFTPTPGANIHEAILEYIIGRRVSLFFNDEITLPGKSEEYIRNYLFTSEKKNLIQIARIVSLYVEAGSFVATNGSQVAKKMTKLRMDYKAGKLCETYISLLNYAGFPWNPRLDSFNDKVERLVDHFEENGNFRFPKGESESPLWVWIREMRSEFAEGTLAQWKVEILRSINYPLSKEEWDEVKEDEQREKDEQVLRDLIQTAQHHHELHGFVNPQYPGHRHHDAEKRFPVQQWERKYWKTLKMVCAWVRSGWFVADHPLIKELIDFGVDVLDINREGGRKKCTEASYFAQIQDACYETKFHLLDEYLVMTPESYHAGTRIRPDGYIVMFYTRTNHGRLRRDDYVEGDEDCHNCLTSKKENRKINIVVITAIESGANRINIIRINFGTNKEADHDQIDAVKKLVEYLDTPSNLSPGVFLYLIDYPEWHPHAIAYKKRVKPTISERREEDGDDVEEDGDDVEEEDDTVRPQSVCTPTTMADVDKTNLPIFDGIEFYYSNDARNGLFSETNMYDSENEDEEGEDMEAGEGKAEEE